MKFPLKVQSNIKKPKLTGLIVAVELMAMAAAAAQGGGAPKVGPSPEKRTATNLDLLTMDVLGPRLRWAPFWT